MSRTVQTILGRMIWLPNEVAGEHWALEMPCGEWERIGTEQFHGRLSVNHAASCRSSPPCTYHETHDYAAAMEAVS